MVKQHRFTNDYCFFGSRLLSASVGAKALLTEIIPKWRIPTKISSIVVCIQNATCLHLTKALLIVLRYRMCTRKRLNLSPFWDFVYSTSTHWTWVKRTPTRYTTVWGPTGNVLYLTAKGTNSWWHANNHNESSRDTQWGDWLTLTVD